MIHDRLVQVRIQGLRVIGDLTLDLNGLTVLTGDNGAGKSTILEAFELLRLAANPVNYASEVISKKHGGLRSLLRRGATELVLGVVVEGEASKIHYEFAIGHVGPQTDVLRERFLSVAPDGTHRTFIREGHKVFWKYAGESTPGKSDPTKFAAESGSLFLATVFGVRTLPEMNRLLTVLSQIQLHVPFETRPVWLQKEISLTAGPRLPSIVEPTHALARYAFNLPSAYQQLRNQGTEAWARVLELARLGLGEDLRDISLAPAGRGTLELELRFGSLPDKPVAADALSEGQISYLAFVALCELHDKRSLLALDNPEHQLHPSLLARVVWMLEQAATHAPVVVATHSDAFLDALTDPEKCIVFCELDDAREMHARRLHPARFRHWLQSYRGLGDLRANGMSPHVFEPKPVREAPKPTREAVVGAEDPSSPGPVPSKPFFPPTRPSQPPLTSSRPPKRTSRPPSKPSRPPPKIGDEAAAASPPNAEAIEDAFAPSPEPPKAIEEPAMPSPHDPKVTEALAKLNQELAAAIEETARSPALAEKDAEEPPPPSPVSEGAAESLAQLSLELANAEGQPMTPTLGPPPAANGPAHAGWLLGRLSPEPTQTSEDAAK